MALKQAPGVLAVQVDYETELATIGMERNRPVSRDKILESLQSIGYQGEFLDDASSSQP